MRSECVKVGDAELWLGDCREVLATLPAESVDAIVTDPPAGIGFMGKTWDDDKGGRDQWIAWMEKIAEQCLRAIKPGGHALVWALPRTSHWTATAWENAGWQVRDRVAHIFGSGFPKSTDVSKQIDKAAGAEREVTGPKMRPDGKTALSARSGDESRREGWDRPWRNDPDAVERNGMETAPATDAARAWEGWGTALKPAMEDWWLLRKPLIGTVAENVQRFGTGALNIDACRVALKGEAPSGSGDRRGGNVYAQDEWTRTRMFNGGNRTPDSGRWPANVIHDGSEEVVSLFPQTTSGTLTPDMDVKPSSGWSGGSQASRVKSVFTANEGSAARFFYCAKASKEDRDAGLQWAASRILARSCQAQADAKRGRTVESGGGAFNKARIVKNHHPTVKATALCRYLCRLITPPGGVVMDLFMGSGSIGKAAVKEGFRFIGIELDADYFEIARIRIEDAQRQAPLFPAVEQAALEL